jgi:Uma2 family endonuclease
VVEVLSPGTARRDRTLKLRWYRRYGVKECWLVDPRAGRIEIVDLSSPRAGRVVCGEDDALRSCVLPGFRVKAGSLLERSRGT